MTFLESTAPGIWMIESPLNDEYEEGELIKIGYRDLPSNRDGWQIGQDMLSAASMQQRMFMILSLATSAIIIFGLLVLPRLLSKEVGGETAVSANTSSTATQSEESTIFSAAGNNIISPLFSPEVQYWAPQIGIWAAAFNLDPNMVATIMQIESCGDPLAVSPAGAQGLFQVMPFHFANGEDTLNPETNAMRGMAYFSERLQQTSGNVGQAFAGYNGGHVAAGTTWDNWANETQRYFTWSTGIYADVNSGLESSPTLQQWMTAGGTSLCQQAANRLDLQ